VLKIGASFGVAPLSAETESVEAWLAAADAACYAAKRAGRGTVRSADGSPPAEREITRRGGL
jgi:GGDEF domain-containing protein